MKDKDRVIGLRETVKMIKQGRVSSIKLALNADENIVNQILDLCKDTDIKIEKVKRKEKLGQSCGIERPAAVVAYLKVDET